MKKRFTLLFAALFSFMGVWAQVQVLDDGVYTIKNVINGRGTLVAVKDQVNVGAAGITLSGYEGKSETSMTDGDKWYVCTKGNSVYFYNVANGQFLNGRTADQVQFSEQPQADGFALVAHDNYFAIVTGNYKLSCCPGYDKGQTVRWLPDDEADSQHLTFAAVENGDKDYAAQITDAETELAKIVRFSYSFVYNGEEKYSQDCASFVDADYPAITKNFPFGVVASKPSGKVSADVAGTKVEVNLTINLPFEYVESIEDYETLSEMEEATGKWKWYYLTFHANNKRKLYYDGTANVLDASKSAVEEAKEDAYSWAFVGNPFDGFKVVNKLAGAEKGLQAGADGGYVGGAAEVFKLTTSTYGVKGFFMQAATGNNTQRFNFSNNQVKYWSDADAGSTFMVELRKTKTQRRIELVAEVNQLLEDNECNHTEEPALGQYTTAGYEALSEIAEDADATIELLEAAVLAFDLTKNRPIFTIDGVVDYALGMSIYDDPDHVNAKGNSHYFNTTDVTDEYMLWTFDLTDTVVGVTDAVKVRNLGSGNLFWGAPAIVVTETSPAIEDDGVFLFYANGGDPVHAQKDNKVITKWNAKDAASGSAWKFTFVGVSNPAAYDLSEVKEAFATQATAFAELGKDEAFTVLKAIKEQYTTTKASVDALAEKIAADALVLKSEVQDAMGIMKSFQDVIKEYNESYAALVAEAQGLLAQLKEGSEDYLYLAGAIAEFEYVTPDNGFMMAAYTVKQAVNYLCDIDAPYSIGEEAWVEATTTGFDGSIYPLLNNADLTAYFTAYEDEEDENGEVVAVEVKKLKDWDFDTEKSFDFDNGIVTFAPVAFEVEKQKEVFLEYENGNWMKDDNGDWIKETITFIEKQDTLAYLTQSIGSLDAGQYRLTGKGYHQGAKNAKMFIGKMDYSENILDTVYKVAVPEATAFGEDLLIEFTIAEATYDEYVIGYSCDFDDLGASMVVGGFKFEMFGAVTSTLRKDFQKIYQGNMMMGEMGFSTLFMMNEYYYVFEAMYLAYEGLSAKVTPLYNTMVNEGKVLKTKVEEAIEAMETMMAEIDAVAKYTETDEYWYATGDEGVGVANVMAAMLNEESTTYKTLVAAIDAARVLSDVTSVEGLKAKVAAVNAALALIPTDIELDEDEVELGDENPSVQLVATVTGAKGSVDVDKTVYWVSNNQEVATVDATGKVTAVGNGEAKITAYSIDNTLYAECYVTVSNFTTGIDGFEVKVETVIYDIHGRRVTEMVKGLYIVNGRKVLVK